ncbi:MAG: PrsW family intramembrane metalloprotease [Bacteroidota bacterium]
MNRVRRKACPYCLIVGLLLLASPVRAAGSEENASPIVFSLVILAILLAVGVQALFWSYQNRYRGGKKFLAYAAANPIVRLVGVTVAVIFIVSAFAPNPWTDNPHQQAEYAQIRGLPTRAALAYRRILDEYPRLPEYHYKYVSAYCRKGDWRNTSSVLYDPDPLMSPFPYYQRLLRSRDKYFNDLARLGLGIMDYYQFMRNLSRERLLEINDTTLAYRNLFLGMIAEGFGELGTANRYYRQEFKYGGDREKAVLGLVRMKMSYDRDDLPGVYALMTDPRYGPYVPEAFKRYYYVKEGKLQAYFASVGKEWWDGASLIGWGGAGLGLLIWIIFLQRVDIFRAPKWGLITGAVVSGALFSFVALPLYDVLAYELNFELTGDFGHDFLYCVFGIGMVEETVKMAPLLLIVLVQGKNMRPLDYVLYGSMSALGFAFVENISYLDDASVSIIHGRVLITVVFHMFATSTVAFGMVLGRFRYPKYRIPLFIGFFFLAALLHGVYDFWLVTPQLNGFYFLAYVVFVYATFQFAAYINNCLNNSPVFKGKIVLNPGHLAQFLLIALVGVLLFEYVALSFAYGPTVGNMELANSMGMGSFLMFFVVLNLSYIDVVQGEWFPVRFWNFSNRANYNAVIGQEIELVPSGPESILARTLPAQGEVIARLKVNSNNRYFLVEFGEPVDFFGARLRFVLIRARTRDEIVEPGHRMEVALVAFRDREALIRTHKRREDFRLLDYAILK